MLTYNISEQSLKSWQMFPHLCQCASFDVSVLIYNGCFMVDIHLNHLYVAITQTLASMCI